MGGNTKRLDKTMHGERVNIVEEFQKKKKENYV